MLSAAVFVPWGKPDRIPRNTFSTDLNVITKYLGEAINAQLLPGLPCLWDKHCYYKHSVLRTVKCEHVTDFIPRYPNQEPQALPACTNQAWGSRWYPAPWAVLGAKQEGPHVKNTVPLPTNAKSFVCLVFNDSKPSLWWFVAGCALCHCVQEITELGLTRIPHTQLGLSWDVPSLTSFLASLLMWILVFCTGLFQTQLPNSLTRQIRLKINHCQRDSVA